MPSSKTSSLSAFLLSLCSTLPPQSLFPSLPISTSLHSAALPKSQTLPRRMTASIVALSDLSLPARHSSFLSPAALSLGVESLCLSVFPSIPMCTSHTQGSPRSPPPPGPLRSPSLSPLSSHLPSPPPLPFLPVRLPPLSGSTQSQSLRPRSSASTAPADS